MSHRAQRRDGWHVKGRPSSVEYEGVEAGVPPRQVWCPRCGRTIIDAVVEQVCSECDPTTDALRSGDR